MRAKILRAAIRLNDDIVVIGLNHAAIILSLAASGSDTPITQEQGFIDQTGAFLNRSKARLSAELNNQLNDRAFPHSELFSEHLIYLDGIDSRGIKQLKEDS